MSGEMMEPLSTALVVVALLYGVAAAVGMILSLSMKPPWMYHLDLVIAYHKAASEPPSEAERWALEKAIQFQKEAAVRLLATPTNTQEP